MNNAAESGLLKVMLKKSTTEKGISNINSKAADQIKLFLPKDGTNS